MRSYLKNNQKSIDPGSWSLVSLYLVKNHSGKTPACHFNGCHTKDCRAHSSPVLVCLLSLPVAECQGDACMWTSILDPWSVCCQYPELQAWLPLPSQVQGIVFISESPCWGSNASSWLSPSPALWLSNTFILGGLRKQHLASQPASRT